MKNTCPQCKQSFDCSGCKTGQCWCMDYPAIFSGHDDFSRYEEKGTCQSSTAITTTSKGCLCPQCLLHATQAYINKHIDTMPVHPSPLVLTPRQQQKTFIEVLDYTIEQGNYVFTRWFLLKQGKCCANKCRNCPYGYVNVVHP